MKLILLFLPMVSALIGWFTCSMLLKLLFSPEYPVKVMWITFQGFFPKRQKHFSNQVSELITTEIVSLSDIENKIADPTNVGKLLPVLDAHIDVFLREKLPVQIPMLGMLIGDRTIAQVKAVFIKELEELFPILMKQYMKTLQNELDLNKIIAEKLGKFSSKKIEKIVKKTLWKELRFVKITGAVLGFIIGLLQVFLTIAAT